MIVFGTALADEEAYARYAAPGIQLAREEDGIAYAFAPVAPIGRAYNLLLDAAATHEDLEAFVIVHPRCEITDTDFVAKVRAELADPGVAIVGCVGARDVTSIAWWDAALVAGPVVRRYGDHGGGELPLHGWRDAEPAPGDVEVVDGNLLVLSPWAVRNLRFDEQLWLGYGFDIDLCLQALEAGRKVRVAPLSVTLHQGFELVEVPETWAAAHVAFATKWGHRLRPMPAEEDDVEWRERARRAEAERDAARAMTAGRALMADAELGRLQEAFDAATGTLGWRLTEPLRRGNQLRRERARRKLP